MLISLLATTQDRMQLLTDTSWSIPSYKAQICTHEHLYTRLHALNYPMLMSDSKVEWIRTNAVIHTS